MNSSWTNTVRLAARLLLRDWRSGELTVLMSALLVAVTAMTGVAFLTDRVVAASDEGLASVIDREGKIPTVTLDADPGIDLEPARSVPGHVRLASFRLNRVVFDVTAKRPAVLVMNQAAFPGWSVRLDDEPRPLLVADGALRAVALGPGVHEVEFRYRPPLLATGAAVSAAFWIGLTLAAALRFRRRHISRSAADYSM